MKHKTMNLIQCRLPKLPWKGFLAACFLILFLLGILAANWTGSEKLIQYGMLNDYYVRQLAYMDLDSGAYFAYLLNRRLRIFGLTALLVYTRFGIFMLAGVIGWNAFLLGYLFVNALVCMRFQGMVLVVLSVFPQVIFYTAAYIGLGRILFGQNTEIVMPVGKQKAFKNPRLLLLLSALLCMAAGIWLESYVNPVLLRSYIRRM